MSDVDARSDGHSFDAHLLCSRCLRSWDDVCAHPGPCEATSADAMRDYKRARRESPDKNPAAVALGRRGGLKGGPARAAKLSPEERKAIARKGGEARKQKAKDAAKDLRVREFPAECSGSST